MSPRTRKKEVVDLDFRDEAEMLKVLAHPVRLKIVNGLIQDSSNVKEIWTRLDLPQATISQHLALLKSKGIVDGSRLGTRVTYSVKHPLVKKIVRVLVDAKKK